MMFNRRESIKIYALMMGLFFIISNSLMAEEQYTKRELRALEEKYNRRLQSGIAEYLGDTSKFGSFLKFEYSEVVDTTQDEVNNAGKTEGGNAVDLGYLDTPQILHGDINKDSSADGNYKIDGVNVDVLLYQKYKTDVMKDIRFIVSRLMPDIQAKVNFQNLTMPAIDEEDQKKQQEADSKQGAKQEKEKGLTDKLMDNLPSLAGLTGMIFLATVILIGLVIIGQAFKSAFSSLGESISSALKQTTVAQGGSDGKEEDFVARSEDAVNVERLGKNIDVIVQTIKTQPFVFSTSIGTSTEDYQGIGRLLPMMVERELSVDTLKSIISESTIKRIEEEKKINGLFNEVDFCNWVNTFVERITINQLKKGNYYSQILDGMTVKKLYGLDSKDFIDYAKKSGEGIVYKIAIDFLPPDNAREFLNSFTSEEWRLVLEDKTVNTEVVNKIALKIISEIGGVVIASKKQVTPEQTLEEVMVTPIQGYLAARYVTEYDSFIDEIEAISPLFAKKIRKNVWTPSTLLSVPKDYLGKTFQELSIERKGQLVLGLPEETARYLLDLHPDGKVRIILYDQLKKKNTQIAKDIMDSAQAACRKFLTQLQNDEKNGKFVLDVGQSEIPPSRIQSINESVDFDDSNNEDIKKAA